MSECKLSLNYSSSQVVQLLASLICWCSLTPKVTALLLNLLGTPVFDHSISCENTYKLYFNTNFTTLYMQRCQSGRMCTLGKRVYSNVPRVQIPPAAPVIQSKFLLNLLFYFWSGFEPYGYQLLSEPDRKQVAPGFG